MWCGVSAKNNKVIDAGVSVVLVCWVVVVLCGRLVFGFGVVDRVRDGEVRERSHGLYPVRNAGFVIAF